MTTEEMNLVFAMALGALNPRNESYQYTTYYRLMELLFKNFVNPPPSVTGHHQNGSTFYVLQIPQQLSATARFGGWPDHEGVSRIVRQDRSVRCLTSDVQTTDGERGPREVPLHGQVQCLNVFQTLPLCSLKWRSQERNQMVLSSGLSEDAGLCSS